MVEQRKTFHLEAQANAWADEMNREEKEIGDGWTYKVNPCGNGLAVIEVYDESGVLVGYL